MVINHLRPSWDDPPSRSWTIYCIIEIPRVWIRDLWVDSYPLADASSGVNLLFKQTTRLGFIYIYTPMEPQNTTTTTTTTTSSSSSSSSSSGSMLIVIFPTGFHQFVFFVVAGSGCISFKLPPIVQPSGQMVHNISPTWISLKWPGMSLTFHHHFGGFHRSCFRSPLRCTWLPEP